MAIQPHFLGSMTLKALLEDPNLKNPPLIGQSSSSLKVKKEDDNVYPKYNYGSAFLGPNLWDRTLDSTDFNLEYMDLDEFLSENGIPLADQDNTNAPLPRNNSSPNIQYKPVSPTYSNPTTPVGPVGQLVSPHHQHPSSSKSPSPPVSPLNVEFQVSEQDLALASIPGHGEFDPRKRNFTEEELKPQPIIKKSKKVFVPDGMKDDKYWARRHKNNFAAKRSRDARRVKENQIAMRAAFLEKENSCLREEMAKLRKENVQLKAKVEKYESPMPSMDAVVGLSL
ncbi:hypothetical protein EGW08_012968 [Elysia chlorotica]|uniref:BZIP domain-containing protein n=1 Tax=Elysia chlorotica TaxID=188477 RepID=A0A3S0ZHX2_ELYCH|nr:hypothetical protein EGW08_012968 [Elysia chlorotica]